MQTRVARVKRMTKLVLTRIRKGQGVFFLIFRGRTTHMALAVRRPKGDVRLSCLQD